MKFTPITIFDLKGHSKIFNQIIQYFFFKDFDVKSNFQDDSITDEEALTKYAEYKLEFKRQQLNQFFGLHR